MCYSRADLQRLAPEPRSSPTENEVHAFSKVVAAETGTPRTFIALISRQATMEQMRMTKPLTTTVQPVPAQNRSHKGAGSAPPVPVDTTKGHRDDEKQNVREQAAHGNLTQNTSNRRMG